jgi:hypothetical protein
MAGQAAVWAGVGSENRASNQRVTSDFRSSGIQGWKDRHAGREVKSRCASAGRGSPQAGAAITAA